jgi:hypothetical protein
VTVRESVPRDGGGEIRASGKDLAPGVSVLRPWRPERQATSFNGRLFRSCVSSEANPERQSLALGVGHCAAALGSMRSPAEPRWFGPPFVPSVARGVGHIFTRSHASPANVFPWPLPWLGAFPVVRFSLSEARGVGQEEDAGSLVRGSNVTCTNDGPDSSVAAGFEVLTDEGNSPNCSGDVLPEEERGFALDGDADVLEEEAGTLPVESCPLAGEGEILARRSTSDEIHEAAPRSSVEGAHVVPDRSLRQPRFRHPSHDDGRSEGFPLDVHHRLHSTGSCEAEIEPPDAGTDTDRGSRGTWSHTAHLGHGLSPRSAPACPMWYRALS